MCAVRQNTRMLRSILAAACAAAAAFCSFGAHAQNNVLYITSGAASDAITGLNRNTFRSGRQTLQDVIDARNIFPSTSSGKKVAVFAELLPAALPQVPLGCGLSFVALPL